MCKCTKICTDGRYARAYAPGFERPPRPPTHRGIALAPTAGYPDGNFRGNQLLDGSISLSPLYPSPDRHALTRTFHRRSGSVGGATPRGIPPISFLAPCGFTHPLTPTHVRLLDPCFKTGRMGSPHADSRSTQVPKHASSRALPSTIAMMTYPQSASQSASVDAPSRLADQQRRSTSDRGASPTPICIPPDNFKHSLTLFSKSFSSFPRDTCSLSISRQYLALDGIYRPIRAAFPNNPTRRQRLVVQQGPSTMGFSPSLAPASRGLGPGPPLRTFLQTTIQTPRATDSHGGLFPVALGTIGVARGSPGLETGEKNAWPAMRFELDNHPRALSLRASGATCVQRLDGSRDSAIHTKYPILLRSSSMQEPRYPLPRVVVYSCGHSSPQPDFVPRDGGENDARIYKP
ncbi:hypothetical protein PIB30_096853 [Stylosanthes scabra]|uniref:Uncharacterized protein n=1 Tax=Stylosanthes scabra TaxID=79078 RepID=A0ABU6UVR4_9FABA|nr:hypothetical protein [Stylosanthes scabra]